MEDHIVRSAHRLRIAILVVSAVLLLLYLAGRLGLPIVGPPIHSHSRAADAVGIPLIGDGITLCLAIAIYWLTEALRRIGPAELFSIAVIRCFRLFAFWLLLMALFGFLTPLLLARFGPPRMHRIMLVIDIRDLLLIGITLVLFLLARLLERARAIESEMREFV
jgi:hypothetical protein